MSERKLLKQEEAMTLFKEGKEEWNKWVEKNPECDIDFKGADFTEFERVSFEGFNFPKQGNVSFIIAQFGDGVVSFKGAKFGKGDVNFSGAKFGKGNVIFHEAQFSEGNIDFSGIELNEGNVGFLETDFGKGNVNFSGAKFSNGDVKFCGAKFGDGDVNIWKAIFGKGQISFAKATFLGRLEFSPKSIEKAKIIDFSAVTFDNEVLFNDFSTTVVLDLRRVKLSHPIDLDKVVINYSHEDYAKNATCFRRLKNLAKEANDHERALEFFAKEMRSDYGLGIKGGRLFFYYLYDWLSDYGRSLCRPLVALIVVWDVFSFIYWFSRERYDALLIDGMVFSIGHIIPLQSGARDARTGAISALFGNVEDISAWVHFLAIFQGVLSTAFIFLFALALRNLFRSS